MLSARVRVSALALVIVGLSGLGAVSAQAHSQLISSTPANGAVLSAAPAVVDFEFDEVLLPDVDTVSINNEQGQNVYSQKTTPVGTHLTIDWPTNLPADTYQVAYRVVSADGHPVTGAITFTFGKPAPKASSSTPPVASQPEQSSSAVWAIGLAVVLLALSFAVIYVLVKRRR